MGNTVSCCVSPESSPKLPSRQPAERLEEFQTSTEVSDDNTVPYLQHISDREVPDGRCLPDSLHTFRLESYKVDSFSCNWTHEVSHPCCLFTGRYILLKKLLHVTPKHTKRQNQQIFTSHVHTHTCLRDPSTNMDTQTGSILNVKTTWWYILFHNCREIHSQTPALPLAKLLEVFIAILLPAVYWWWWRRRQHSLVGHCIMLITLASHYQVKH